MFPLDRQSLSNCWRTGASQIFNDSSNTPLGAVRIGDSFADGESFWLPAHALTITAWADCIPAPAVRMRGMTRQAKSLAAFLAAVFCIAAILVMFAKFGGIVGLVAALVLGAAAYRLMKAGLALWNAPA